MQLAAKANRTVYNQLRTISLMRGWPEKTVFEWGVFYAREINEIGRAVILTRWRRVLDMEKESSNAPNAQ